MNEFSIIGKVNEVDLTCEELLFFVKQCPTCEVKIKTRYDIEEFFSHFGKYCYSTTLAHHDIEDSEFFSLIGRMTFDHYIVGDYTLIYKTDKGYVTSVIKKAK